MNVKCISSYVSLAYSACIIKQILESLLGFLCQWDGGGVEKRVGESCDAKSSKAIYWAPISSHPTITGAPEIKEANVSLEKHQCSIL